MGETNKGLGNLWNTSHHEVIKADIAARSMTECQPVSRSLNGLGLGGRQNGFGLANDRMSSFSLANKQVYTKYMIGSVCTGLRHGDVCTGRSKLFNNQTASTSNDQFSAVCVQVSQEMSVLVELCSVA